jgi:hypothetical protein
MHQFIHQMWLEGAFNIMDLNQVNTEAKLCESKLLNKMNKTSGVRCDGDEVRREAADIKQTTTANRKDMPTRKLNILNVYTCQPTQQRKSKTIR